MPGATDDGHVFIAVRQRLAQCFSHVGFPHPVVAGFLPAQLVAEGRIELDDGSENIFLVVGLLEGGFPPALAV